MTLRPRDRFPAFSISRCVEHPGTCPKPDLFPGSLSSWLPGRCLHILRITVGLGFCGHPAHRGLAVGCLLPIGRANGGLRRSEYPFCVVLGRHFTPEFVWSGDIYARTRYPGTLSRLGLRISRFRRSSMTALLPCLHSSFAMTTCSTPRRHSAGSLSPFYPCTPTFDDHSLAVG